MKPRPARIVLHIFMPLVAGFFIYYRFRPDNWIIRQFTDRQAVPHDPWPQAVQWLIFSGPDFCWAYSLASALYTWEAWQGNRKRFFPLFVMGVIALSELLQGTLIPGFTFDMADLVAVMAGAVLSTLFYRKKV
ncbi:MAG: hypothetical protein JNM88_15160 [Chitinophagaceae bacterium]|nr:hypothetical protein [Chitinophagaceae bacterium]